MANTIKLKRASGSDPSASDLSVGELAIRTSNCKLFSRNDGGSAVGIVAGSADTLTTARTIAGVSFDGSANISLNNNAITNGAGYLADIVSDSSPQLGSDLDVQSNKITTATSNGNVKIEPNGTGVVEVRGAGGNDGKLQLNCSAQSHGIKLASPAHSAGQSYTLIFPDNQIAADKYLKIKSISGSGSTAIGQAEYASLDANDLGEGTIPDARFPSTLPALNGSALTDLNGSNIASGTIAAARVATLNQDTTGSSASCTGNAATATALANARTIAGVSFDGTSNISLNNNAITNGAGYITATLTEEQVEDFVGGMVTGNTETGITVTYQDSDGTLDFVVASQTDNNFTTTLKNKLDGIESGATADQSKSDIDALGIAASTAATLATARNIGGVSFNGSANIDLPGVNSSGNQDTSGNAATATTLETARTIAGVSFDGSANISLNNNAITNGAGYITGSSLNASNLSSGTIPDARFPSTLPAVDGSNLTGISAGATGGGSDEVFYENDQTVTTNYTITNGKNAMAAGPITINSGVTVTVGSGETLTIV